MSSTARFGFVRLVEGGGLESFLVSEEALRGVLGVLGSVFEEDDLLPGFDVAVAVAVAVAAAVECFFSSPSPWNTSLALVP